MLRGKFLVINAYIEKKERSQIKNLKELEKQKQTKSKVSRSKEMTKTGAKMNEIKNRKTIEKINKTKNYFLNLTN